MTKTQRFTLAATGLGLFMIYLDALIVNVALPAIQSDFKVGEALFDSDSKPAAPIQGALDFCQKFEEAGAKTRAFVEELKAWWRAIVQGDRVENSVEAARRDMALLAKIGRKVASAT